LGVVVGPIFAAIAVGGWALFAQGTRRPGSDESLLVALLGTLGLLVGAVGIGALIAAPRFPVVAHMAGTNDFLRFVAVSLAGVGSVALVVLGSPGFALLPIVASATLLILSSAVRKILRSPEARTPEDARSVRRANDTTATKEPRDQ
jgi:hypothetical protein